MPRYLTTHLLHIPQDLDQIDNVGQKTPIFYSKPCNSTIEKFDHSTHWLFRYNLWFHVKIWRSYDYLLNSQTIVGGQGTLLHSTPPTKQMFDYASEQHYMVEYRLNLVPTKLETTGGNIRYWVANYYDDIPLGIRYGNSC